MPASIEFSINLFVCVQARRIGYLGTDTGGWPAFLSTDFARPPKISSYRRVLCWFFRDFRIEPDTKVLQKLKTNWGTLFEN
jgi:hypothetical protein